MSFRVAQFIKPTILSLALIGAGFASTNALAAPHWHGGGYGGYHGGYHHGYYGHHAASWLGLALATGIAADVIYNASNPPPPVVYGPPAYNPYNYGVVTYTAPPVTQLPPGSYYARPYQPAIVAPPPMVYRWDPYVGRYVLVPR